MKKSSIKKIAFVGSVGSGKTTIIESLSSIDTLNTDVKSSVDIGKEMTTVGIDYGQISLNKDMILALYGVPGQRKYSMVWDFVNNGLWAIVLLIKSNNIESIKEIEYIIDYFKVDVNTPCIVGITHADEYNSTATKKHLTKIFNKNNLKVPIFSIDPRLKSSSMLIMDALIAIDENN